MGLRDRVIATKVQQRNPFSTCSVVRYAERLSPEQRAEWLDCANDRELPALILVQEAKAEFGVEPDFGDTPIQRHRRRQCICWRGSSVES